MKKFLPFIFLIAFASTLHAAYLHWQVAPGFNNNNIEIGGENEYYLEGREITKAHVMVSNDGGVTYEANGNNFYIDDPTEYYDYAEVGYAEFSPETDVSQNFCVNLGDILDGSQYMFYIEIIGYDARLGEVVIGRGEEFTYAQLVAENWIDPTELLPSTTAWTGGTYVVPEPTSALLLILGFGALGLKRRNERV